MHASELIDRLTRARLYVVSGEAEPERQADVLCLAIDGGADLVQLRHKTADKGVLLAAARRVREHANGHGALFIVNDHLDLAMACDADGVHLGQSDLPLSVARRLWPDHIVGRSTHSLDQAVAAEAEGADYLGVGPVFDTPTKPGRPAIGVDVVSQIAARAATPWFAIGGIQLRNLDEVLAAGATRVAVVRAVCDATDPSAATSELAAQLRRAAVVQESLA